MTDADRISFQSGVAVHAWLKPSDYGLKFIHGGRQFTVVDYKNRNRKYPLILESSGKRFKVAPHNVRREIEAARLTSQGEVSAVVTANAPSEAYAKRNHDLAMSAEWS